jgi:hypothetical protein
VSQICELSLPTEAPGKPSAKKPLYHIKVVTSEYTHLIGYSSLLHCLEWHEHLDTAIRTEIMDSTGRSSSSSGGLDCG